MIMIMDDGFAEVPGQKITRQRSQQMKINWKIPAKSAGEVTILWKIALNIKITLENATENPR